jgi:hypothetical protein
MDFSLNPVFDFDFDFDFLHLLDFDFVVEFDLEVVVLEEVVVEEVVKEIVVEVVVDLVDLVELVDRLLQWSPSLVFSLRTYTVLVPLPLDLVELTQIVHIRSS